MTPAWPFAPLQKLHYHVVLADPPWNYETYSEKGQGKSASQHYSVMSLDVLKELPVYLLAADDAVLVMWTTQSHLPQAFELMAAWGFAYSTAGAWAKQSSTGRSWAFGTGYTFRSAAEFFIVGTMGQPKCAVHDVRNLIVAPVREHSRKPDEMYVALERMFPKVRKCELFSRGSRRGWEHWGLEHGKFGEAA